jgi:hypothetical protein
MMAWLRWVPPSHGRDAGFSWIVQARGGAAGLVRHEHYVSRAIRLAAPELKTTCRSSSP